MNQNVSHLCLDATYAPNGRVLSTTGVVKIQFMMVKVLLVSLLPPFPLSVLSCAISDFFNFLYFF
jgi:hypothetical protein